MDVSIRLGNVILIKNSITQDNSACSGYCCCDIRQASIFLKHFDAFLKCVRPGMRRLANFSPVMICASWPGAFCHFSWVLFRQYAERVLFFLSFPFYRCSGKRIHPPVLSLILWFSAFIFTMTNPVICGIWFEAILQFHSRFSGLFGCIVIFEWRRL